MKLFFFLLLSNFLLQPTFASDLCITIFGKVFQSAEYVSGECQANVCRLLKNLNDSKVDLKKTTVVFFIGALAPKNARKSYVEWPYHAFVQHNGTVLDMDYGTSPNPQPLAKYLAENWLPSGYDKDPALRKKMGKQVQVIEVPAEVFLAKYPLKKDTLYEREKFSEETLSRYPILPLDQYVR